MSNNLENPEKQDNISPSSKKQKRLDMGDASVRRVPLLIRLIINGKTHDAIDYLKQCPEGIVNRNCSYEDALETAIIKQNLEVCRVLLSRSDVRVSRPADKRSFMQLAEMRLPEVIKLLKVKEAMEREKEARRLKSEVLYQQREALRHKRQQEILAKYTRTVKEY